MKEKNEKKRKESRGRNRIDSAYLVDILLLDLLVGNLGEHDTLKRTPRLFDGRLFSAIRDLANACNVRMEVETNKHDMEN
jgi:hypothetical protein